MEKEMMDNMEAEACSTATALDNKKDMRCSSSTLHSMMMKKMKKKNRS
jgi:hypothetical protein